MQQNVEKKNQTENIIFLAEVSNTDKMDTELLFFRLNEDINIRATRIHPLADIISLILI